MKRLCLVLFLGILVTRPVFSQKAEVFAQLGHTLQISSVDFSPDGKTIATGSADGTAKIWDKATGRELGTLLGHGNLVGPVRFSPNGKLLATGSVDRTIKLWDLAEQRNIRTIAGHTGVVTAVEFARN